MTYGRPASYCRPAPTWPPASPRHAPLRCYRSAWRPTATPVAVGTDRRPTPRDLGRRSTVAPLPVAPCHYPLTPWATQPAHVHGAVVRHLRRRPLVGYPTLSDSLPPALTVALAIDSTSSLGTPTTAHLPRAARSSLDSPSPSPPLRTVGPARARRRAVPPRIRPTSSLSRVPHRLSALPTTPRLFLPPPSRRARQCSR